MTRRWVRDDELEEALCACHFTCMVSFCRGNSSVSVASIAAPKIHCDSFQRNSERIQIEKANFERNRQRETCSEPRDPTGHIMAAVHVSAGTLRSRVPLSALLLAHRMASPHGISAIRRR
ncbi:hypothetical protein HN011_007017 [Eciton burchellii]|nr:hypothetical protein HN011_007017 [Eciton burchellii]